MPERLTLEYSGRVIHGRHLARTLGFPTANLDRRQWSRQKLKWKLGVYIGTVTLESKKVYRAAFGLGPLDKKKLPQIEAHLVGFKGSLYNKRLTFRFQKYLRPYIKFSSLDLLKQQIAQDVKQATKLKI